MQTDGYQKIDILLSEKSEYGQNTTRDTAKGEDPANCLFPPLLRLPENYRTVTQGEDQSESQEGT